MKDNVLKRLEELLALDNSDKEYLVDSILQDMAIKKAVSDRIIKMVDDTIKGSENNLIENIVRSSITDYVNKSVEDIKAQIDADLKSCYKTVMSNANADIEKKTNEFSKSVEQELKDVLATEVATHLFDVLSSKK